MANTLDDLMPKILARGLMRLRGRLVLPRAVNTDYSRDAAQRGQTINIPKPPSLSTRTVSPGVTPTAAPDITENTVPLTLDQWEEVPIAFTDKDRLEAIDTSVEMAIDAAVDALAESVNASIFGLYDELYEFVGTPGTTPFASSYATATEARKVLNKNKAQLANRFLVIDPDAEENATNLSSFADSSYSNDSGVITEGDIGRKVGFDWIMDQQVPLHTNGTLTDGTGHQAITDGQPTIGDKTQDFDETSLSGTVTKGSVFTVAGDDQTYVVTEDATAAGNAITLTFEPGAKVAWADGAQMTLKGDAEESYVNNLALHRDSLALAVRPFRAPASNAQVMTMIDPATGLPLRLEVTRQNKQDYWSFDLLWGVKAIRPEVGVRVAG